MLISAGADVNIAETSGDAPIHTAVYNENKEIVRVRLASLSNAPDLWMVLRFLLGKEQTWLLGTAKEWVRFILLSTRKTITLRRYV